MESPEQEMRVFLASLEGETIWINAEEHSG